MTHGPRSGPGLGADAAREEVRQRYGRIAAGGGCCATPTAGGGCGPAGDECCEGPGGRVPAGYTTQDLATVPPGANLGLGCGNPTAIARLRRGQVVLDLGSGAGVDCFLAAKKVGPRGAVIGVDMTPAMVTRAREIARNGGYENVEFRLGEIEHLPVGDASVDVVVSNCVIVLAPDKGPVYREAFRVLRPGGELVASDMVATRPITARDRADPSRWSSCSSGALEVKVVKALLRRAGFVDVSVRRRAPASSPEPTTGEASLGVVSAEIRATKPGT